jgi:hypothetical protein
MRDVSIVARLSQPRTAALAPCAARIVTTRVAPPHAFLDRFLLVARAPLGAAHESRKARESMTGQGSQDPAGSEEPRDEGGSGEFGNAGMGAASALEQMKSQHERRHRRLHGARHVSPQRDDDANHER